MYIFTGCLLNVTVPAQNRENNLEFFFATALKVYHTKLSAEKPRLCVNILPPIRRLVLSGSAHSDDSGEREDSTVTNPIGSFVRWVRSPFRRDDAP